MCCKKKVGERLPRNPKRNELRPSVAEKYDLVGIAVGTYTVKGFGTIHLADICTCIADELVESGFKYLQKKKDYYEQTETQAKPKAKPKKPQEEVELGGSNKANESALPKSLSNQTNTKNE